MINSRAWSPPGCVFPRIETASSSPMRAPLFPLLLALAVLAEASHVRLHHTHKRRHHEIRHDQSVRTSILERGLESVTSATLYKRNGKCQFPSDAGLVAVTPDSKNAGWALSPDQSCEPDSYCPYACPPGQLMAQWDPKATAYIPDQSQVCPSPVRRRSKGRESTDRIPLCSVVDFIVIRVGMFPNHFLINHIVLTERAPWVVQIRPTGMWPFVRRSCRVTRPC